MRLITLAKCLLTTLFISLATTIPSQDSSLRSITFMDLPESMENNSLLVYSGPADWVLLQEHPDSQWGELPIEGLSLDCPDLSQELFRYISTLEQVRWLEISCVSAETTLSKDMYEPLAKMKQLNHLEILYDDRLTPKDLVFIDRLPNLREFIVTPSPFPMSKWHLLAQKKSLKELWINELGAEQTNAARIPETQCQLTSVHLGKLPSNVDLESLLGKQLFLKDLSISRDSLSKKNLLYLRSLPALETFRVGVGAIPTVHSD